MLRAATAGVHYCYLEYMIAPVVACGVVATAASVVAAAQLPSLATAGVAGDRWRRWWSGVALPFGLTTAVASWQHPAATPVPRSQACPVLSSLEVLRGGGRREVS